jgi:hypothetical protein
LRIGAWQASPKAEGEVVIDEFLHRLEGVLVRRPDFVEISRLHDCDPRHIGKPQSVLHTLNETAPSEDKMRQAMMDRWVEAAEARRACVQAMAEETLRLVTPTRQTTPAFTKLYAVLRLRCASRRAAPGKARSRSN